MTVKIDYDSIPRSYREYLDLMVREGEYLAIDDEVDWNLEMGAICRYADETLSPSPIFNKVKDSPGFRAAEWGFTKSVPAVGRGAGWRPTLAHRPIPH
jgi:4-hydroxy-3-polyprenylbenzoate decarboxylase